MVCQQTTIIALERIINDTISPHLLKIRAKWLEIPNYFCIFAKFKNKDIHDESGHRDKQESNPLNPLSLFSEEHIERRACVIDSGNIFQ